MAKKLISYDDEAEGLGLPDVVEGRLDGSYVGLNMEAEDISLVPDLLEPMFLGAGSQVGWLTRDGRRVIYVGAKVRYRIDGGPRLDNSFTFPADVRGVREMGDGEIIASTMPGGGENGGVWKSSGWVADPATATFTKVLTFPSPVGYATAFWSLDALPDGRALAAEYGPYDDTRRVWLSKDNGSTWDLILNSDNLTPPVAGQSHIHGVRIDPFADRIWVTIGDLEPNARVVYTDDEGETWHTILREYTHQVVDVIPFETCVLLTTDASPNGIIRLHRLPDGSMSEPEYPVVINESKHRDPTGFGRLAYQRAPGYPWYITWASSGTPGPGIVWTTIDGLKIHEIWRDTPEFEATNSGVWAAVGPTSEDRVVMSVAYSGRSSGATVSEAWAPSPVWSPSARLVGPRMMIGGELATPENVGLSREANPFPVRMVTSKQSDREVSSQANPQNDWDLTFNRIPRNSRWAIRGVLFVEASSDVPDMKLTVKGPPDATGWFSVDGATPGGITTHWVVSRQMTVVPLGTNHSVGVASAGRGAIRVDATVTVGDTAGAIYLAWAQNTADVSPTKVLSGSYLVAERIDAGTFGDNFPSS